MDPRPSHSGGSVSANAGADEAALISARGTSVCARRSIMPGRPLAPAVLQSATSGSAREMSLALAPASARVAILYASSAANEVPARAAAPVEASSVRECLEMAMSCSQTFVLWVLRRLERFNDCYK